ncbi:hypothetical protein [Halomicrococcus gelatinilyticus]|uniref:hypothetical protein n=1 Tax=Halomicrococcus gelatinilyticus TaxID=1702103 RepID=UPI002E141B38
MTVGDWLEEAKDDYEKYGISSLKYTSQELWHGLLSRAGFFSNYGNDFYDYNWDLLILVDACRWDLMEEVVDEYDFVDSHSNFLVHASHSREFLHKTFMENDAPLLEQLQIWRKILQDPDNIEIFKEHYDMNKEVTQDTAYISWNVFAQMLDPDAFDTFVPVGRAKWGDDQEILPPRELTDRTIDIMRNGSAERTVVHYMQPHTPFKDSDTTEVPGSVWERIQRGEKDRAEALEEYENNLRWVMDDIELLLENVDAEKVIVSSDHGNLIGEFGCYGHRPYVPIPSVKRVPWIETTATDKKTYDPEVEEMADASESEVEARLEALGYK